MATNLALLTHGTFDSKVFTSPVSFYSSIKRRLPQGFLYDELSETHCNPAFIQKAEYQRNARKDRWLFLQIIDGKGGPHKLCLRLPSDHLIAVADDVKVPHQAHFLSRWAVYYALAPKLRREHSPVGYHAEGCEREYPKNPHLVWLLLQFYRSQTNEY